MGFDFDKGLKFCFRLLELIGCHGFSFFRLSEDFIEKIGVFTLDLEDLQLREFSFAVHRKGQFASKGFEILI